MPTKREVGPVTNGAKGLIAQTQPYTVRVRITGTTDLLWRRWNTELRDAETSQRKGGNKTDDLEACVWRDDEERICLPGEYLRMAVVKAAKFRKDPRSPRKSALDLYKAGLVSLTALAPLEPMTRHWDYEHKSRAIVQGNAITRTRPAMKVGWSATVELMVLLPEYISPTALHEVISDAGRFHGVGDFRPTYGRFCITAFDVV